MLLEIKNLQIEFRSGESRVRAVDGVSLSIDQGETVCLVGESGCGKTATALSIARLLRTPPAWCRGGQILLNGENVFKASVKELRQIRGRVISYVFQEPSASLNPVIRVGEQIKESLRLHRPELANDDEVIRLLKMVGISEPESRIRCYPHEMSGGMQQRVMIAMAVAPQPTLLIADEPTAALDVTTQAQIIDLLKELKARLGMSMLLITHCLGIVGEIADRVAVMYAGQIVESGSASELLNNPLHPYTRALLDAVPRLGSNQTRLQGIPGSVPDLRKLPQGCRFHPRCPKALADCFSQNPSLLESMPGRWVRCPHAVETTRLLD